MRFHRLALIAGLLASFAVGPTSAQSFDKAALAHTLSWDADWIMAVCFVDARHLAAGNNLGQILVWEMPEPGKEAKPTLKYRLDGHANVITRLVVGPDGKLISSSNDHTVRFWDLKASPVRKDTVILNSRAIEESEFRKKKPPLPIEAKVEVLEAVKILDAHREWVVSMSLSKDGKTLATGDEKGEVIVWDYPAGKERKRLTVKGWAQALALSPDASLLVITERLPLVFDSGRHAGIKIWDLKTGQVKADLAKSFDKQHLGSAQFSDDGKLLAVGRSGEVSGPNGKATLIDVATAKVKKELTPGHVDGLTFLTFSPDNKHLLTAGRDTLVRVWNVETGKVVKELSQGRGGQFKDWITSLSFSPDGLFLAGGDQPGFVQIWALNSKK